ncbi:MAG TPA: GntR family transcriptional regulator [Planctomycetota bacterium]|nr:GntR family transcriptional regulator [Planctomycetota bacterium]
MDGRGVIYRELNQALLRLIRGRKYQEGDRFLTEREVSGQYKVSRATANKALSTLVAEGVLEFKKGVGTFVRGGGLDYDLRTLVSFTDKACAMGRKPSTRVLARELVPIGRIPPETIQALRLETRDRAVYMERLRLADDVPVILERRHVPAALCPGLERADLAGSLYALWTGKYRLKLGGAEQSIRAVEIGRRVAHALRVREGSAGLLVTSTGFLEDGTPLWHERTLYRGDAYEFRNRLGGLHAVRPAVGTLLER